MDAEQKPPLTRMYKGELARLLGYDRSNDMVNEAIRKNLITVFKEKTGQEFSVEEFRKTKQLSPALANFLYLNL